MSHSLHTNMTQLVDLDDDCLLEVLDRLAPEELFKLQRLNKRMKRLAAVKMQVKIEAISLLGILPFLKCTHFGTVRRDQVLSFIEIIKLNPEILANILLLKPFSVKERAFLLNVFAKCSNIKRIDFELPGDLLLEVFQRCPEIECIKLGRPLFLNDLNRVLDLFGHRLLHVSNDFGCGTSAEEVRLLVMVAEKCPNIKQIDWKLISNLTSEWMTVIKRLPNSCRFNLNCYRIGNGVFEDVIDELEVFADLSPTFINRTHRLSRLRLSKLFITDHNVGAEFVNLRVLEFEKKIDSIRTDDHYFVDFLVASQFPRLEEFCLNVSVDWREEEYETMFGRVATVKRLTLVCEKPLKLPQSAIRRLKKLETIVFEMRNVLLDNQQTELLQQIERYIEEVDSLKKLLVDYYPCLTVMWQQTFKDGIEKLKQSRVAVEFRPYCRFAAV